MRILLIHQYFLEKNDGGGSRFNEMTKQWAQDGHEISVIAGMVHYATGRKREKYKGRFITSEQYEPGVQVFRCHVSESYNISFLGRLWAYLSFVLSGTIAGLFRARGRYDAVIATSPPLFIGIIAYLVSRIRRIPMVFEVRDLWPESAIDTGVLKNRTLIRFSYSFEKFIYKKSSLINVLTPAFRDVLIEKKKVPEQKIIYIPNAADLSLSENVSMNFNRNEFRERMKWNGKTVFLYVGAHGVANHLVQVLEGASTITDKNIHFVLVGDGMSKVSLIEYARDHQLTNVEFIDPVPKATIFEYILGADVGMSVLKKVETFKTIFSNKTFDYMSCHKPVLMLIDGISRKLIEEADAGLYAEPENISEFRNKVMQYADDPNLILAHGQHGYAYVIEHFDRKKLANKYLEYVQENIQANH